MFHAKCLLPRLDELLLLRSCLQNFYQCMNTEFLFGTEVVFSQKAVSDLHWKNIESKRLSKKKS